MSSDKRAGKARSLSEEAALEATSVSNMLARRLQEAIERGDFPVGSSLPTERELMSKYHISRATVREALRALRAQELIEVKRGRSGGSFISSPTSGSVVRSLAQFIMGQDFRFIDLVFAREAIEPAAAVQAALMRSDEQLEKLRALCEECEQALHDSDKFVEANLKWHLGLAEASGNPLFSAFLTAISTAMHTATAFEEFDLRTRKAVVGIHWQIFEAIYHRDAEAARRRTTRHLSAYGEQLASITEAEPGATKAAAGQE